MFLDYRFAFGIVDNVILGVHDLALSGFISEVRAEKSFKWLWTASQHIVRLNSTA